MGFPTCDLDSRRGLLGVSIPGRDLWVFRLRLVHARSKIDFVSIPGRDLWVFRPAVKTQ